MVLATSLSLFLPLSFFPPPLYPSLFFLSFYLWSNFLTTQPTQFLLLWRKKNMQSYEIVQNILGHN